MRINEPSLLGTEWDGRRWNYRWSDGTVLPVIRGGEGEGGDPKDPPTPDPKDLPARTFTQDDVTRIATREKDEGKRAGTREIMDALGITDVEEAKALLEAARAAEDAKKTEAERAAADAAKSKRESDKATTDAQKERLTAKIERQLIRAGVGVDDDAKLTRLARLIDIPNDADDDKVKEAVEQLKKDMPEVFGTKKAPDPKDRKPPASNPGTPPKPNNGTVKDTVDDLLAKRHPRAVAKS